MKKAQQRQHSRGWGSRHIASVVCVCVFVFCFLERCRGFFGKEQQCWSDEIWTPRRSWWMVGKQVETAVVMMAGHVHQRQKGCWGCAKGRLLRVTDVVDEIFVEVETGHLFVRRSEVIQGE